MKIIGLTGGIGAGKSTVAKIFSTLGIPVYDSDSRAKRLYSESQDLRDLMVKHFGDSIYQGSEINRTKLAAIVFKDANKLALLNGLVHPLLAQDFEDWKMQQKTGYVLREAAILIESGAHELCDKVIVVTAAEELRIDRVILRDGTSREAVVERIENQITESKRLSYADFIITNNDDESLVVQVLRIHNSLLS